ncbi:hypothetical protein I4U23_001104 [Adineta vaga]|nr:hypothetical protein I4U23_001104 [Adineta vaga]
MCSFLLLITTEFSNNNFMSYEAVEILMNRKTAYEMSILGSSSPVTSQPTNSIFRISETEDLRQTYECEQKACGCGPTYTVDLTKTRLIQTRQDHLCGCQTDRSDSMIFLSDISYIETNPKCVSFDSCPGGESTCYLLVMCPCLIPFCWMHSVFSNIQ